jgi:hypothetical protein
MRRVRPVQSVHPLSVLSPKLARNSQRISQIYIPNKFFFLKERFMCNRRNMRWTTASAVDKVGVLAVNADGFAPEYTGGEMEKRNDGLLP